VEAIGRRDADLYSADAAFKCLFKELFEKIQYLPIK
jgi:hypothetical protein